VPGGNLDATPRLPDTPARGARPAAGATETTEPRSPTFDPRVGEDGTLSLRREVCQEYGLEPGDPVPLKPVLVGLAVTPVVTDEEAEAFWGPTIWQELEAADAAIRAGRVARHDSDEEFFAALEAPGHADARRG